MRKRFNLDASSPDDIRNILVFGPYGVGKTYLQGDMLKHYQDKGKVRFLNLDQESGYQGLKWMGLGDVGETVDTLADFRAALADYKKDDTYALAIDSLNVLYRLVLKDVTGGELRYPDAKVDGQRAMAMWGQITMGILNHTQYSLAAAKHILWVAPYDKNTDPITGEKDSGKTKVTPYLPGQNALACYGWFDMVGYLDAMPVGPNRMARTLSFSDDGKVITKSRCPGPIPTIQVPEGGGGWTKLRSAIEATFTKGGAK